MWLKGGSVPVGKGSFILYASLTGIFAALERQVTASEEGTPASLNRRKSTGIVQAVKEQFQAKLSPAEKHKPPNPLLPKVST